jgi:hypothetical protein
LKNALSVFAAFVLLLRSAAASTFVVSQDLSFGTLVPISSSGSVVVGINSAITTNGSVSVAPSGTAYYAGLGVFTGSGLSVVADVLTITILSSSVNLSNGSGGVVVVNNFTATPNSSISLLSPSTNVYVGGTMNFTSASTPGNYTGSVQVQGSGLLSGTVVMTLPIILTLWNPLGISQTAALSFGGLEILGGNSVVQIAPQTGARTIVSGTGGVNLISGNPGNAGVFQITGNPNTSVTITLPSTASLTGPGTAMSVSNFTGYPSSTAATLGASGTLTLDVGAQLNVNAAQAAGTYSGTYTLTASY